jgi:hypothetical protein
VLWGVTVFFGWQMLGLIAPYGLIYLLGSYVVALGVANVLMEQRRKNLKTIKSDLKEEVSNLMGLRGGDGAERVSLREIIVAQIRREALYRRMVRDEAAGRTPGGAVPREAVSAARGPGEPLEDGQASPAKSEADELPV